MTDSGSAYYAMLYHALDTLREHYNGSYDVVVYYAVKDRAVDFKKYFHLGKYNMCDEFDYVKFIDSDYDDKYDTTFYPAERNTSDPWMSKWYTLAKSFELGYDKVFLMDCDVIFYRDIGYVFSKYPDEAVPCLFCCVHPLLLSTPGVASGQLIIHKKFIGDPATFYNRVLQHRSYLNDKGEEHYRLGNISEFDLKNWYFFNEQHCGQMALEDEHAIFIPLDPADFATPAWSSIEANPENTYYTVEFTREDALVSNVKTSVVHYTAGYGNVMLPKHLLSNWELQHRHNFLLEKTR